MNSEQFENQARLYIVGALDDAELVAFQHARGQFGEQAEAFIRECHRLNEVFALSLRPRAPKVNAKERLMSLIQRSLRDGGNRGTERTPEPG
jgi:hypothetical protein